MITKRNPRRVQASRVAEDADRPRQVRQIGPRLPTTELQVSLNCSSQFEPGCDDHGVSRGPKPRRPDTKIIDIVGGREALEVQLHAYDDRWPAIYLEQRVRIGNALAPVDFDIQHIGSTSVPGLAAKPIIDIVVPIRDITAEEDYLNALLDAGYVLRVREPGHRLVRTPERDVHVHIFQRHDPAVDEYLLLRDRLRSNADDRALYETTKRSLLAKSWDDMNDYADAKTDVIVAIKERARAVAGLPTSESTPNA
jgi:GrpB-like predicted nucleotidyltransferase (UPF0157 family)